jgi:DNA (cytosine-5)-methyltransferase 1
MKYHSSMLPESFSDYPSLLSERLRPNVRKSWLALDLFAGCGGLALGFEACGFETIGFEMDGDCCETYNRNLAGLCNQQFLKPDTQFPRADILIGGPPCQPFSVGGYQLGLKDARDGFPSFISAVEQLQPALFLFENVRGLLYRNRWYLSEVVARLEQFGYIVEYQLLNAVDFLVPQNRERLVVVGHKGGFRFPQAKSQRVTAGDALGELASSAPEDGRYLTASMDDYVARYERASQCINPRDLRLDKPARTLTCRNLAGATGDMQRIRLEDGRRRRLSIREAARLQSFPDWFEFSGTETSQFNQLGNAVPPMLGYALAESVKSCLTNPASLDELEIRALRQPLQAQLSFE